jgi:diguanylate cyclase (GGDEF)-like protein
VVNRLVALVFLPLVALALVSGSLALRVERDAAGARSVSRDAQAITTRLAALEGVVTEHNGAITETLLSAFDGEQIPSVRQSGAQTALGADWEQTNQAVELLQPPLRSMLAVDLRKARSAIGTSSLSLRTLNDLYGKAEAALVGSSASTLASLQSAEMSTPGNVASGRAVLALIACNDLVDARSNEERDGSMVWFAPGQAGKAEALGLSHDVALFDAAGERLAQSGIPSVAKAWGTYASSPSVARYDQILVDGELDMQMPFRDGRFDPAPGTVPLSVLVAAYGALPAQARLLRMVVSTAGANVRQNMTALAGRNSSEFDLWVILLGVVVAVSLTVAVFTGRSVSRPLRRLGKAASSVVAGDLEVPRLATSGPKEMARVADAFNSLMTNLRLLEAKAQALASCDLDNEILSVPLPGLLGASLEDSVHLLTGSIQDRDELQQRLAHEATHDTLTGLLNRAAAISQLEQALTRATRTADCTALLYVDLDNLKRVNDVYGHKAGDQVLRDVGARLAGASRPGDIVARLGGDEFIVVAERVEGAEEARATAERLLGAVSQPVRWGTVTLNSAASIGLSVCRGGEKSASGLLAEADLALYEAKRQGRGRVGIYDEGLQERLASHEEIQSELRRELAGGGQGLVLYYQPIVDTELVVRGFEALIRWRRPGHGLVGPDMFIPIAETTDLIIDVDNWVLARAARQLVEWSVEPSLAGLGVAVNVSGRHVLSGALPKHVGQMLRGSGAHPGLLTIEVTETVLLNDLTAAAQQFEELRRLGVQVAIDDFGTGYTSLSHLHRLPVDSIKIDRTFVSDIADARVASLVRMIADLAKQLDLTIVAEGVETREQLDILKELGSDRLQGYLIARPMPPDQLSHWANAQMTGAEGTVVGRPTA